MEYSSALTSVIEQLCVDYDLNENNFSLCYYNTMTEETCSYNPDAWMIAGSTYKLPLNMYYYELENAGELSSDEIICGYTLADIHYESIVHSNNELSEALIWNLGSYQHYKELMFCCYGDLDYEEIADIAWSANYFSTQYMLNTLKYLYENAEAFPQLLSYMTEANPDSYFYKYSSDYVIAHKYGAYDTAENDVGIVYTDEPYLLAVYTYGLDNGEDVVARVNEAVCSYNVANIQSDEETESPPDDSVLENAAGISAKEKGETETVTEVPVQYVSPEYTDETHSFSVTALLPGLAILATAGVIVWWRKHHFFD